MRKVKLFAIVAFIISLVLALTACEGIDLKKAIEEAFKNMDDYKYSDNGKEEITTYFSGINRDDFEGKISYIFNTDNEIFNVDLIKEKNGTYIKLIYEDEDEKYAILKRDQKTYYIDYKAKIVSDNFSDTMKGVLISVLVAAYGSVEFIKDGQEVWQFIEKRTAKVKSYDNKDIETVEFEYKLITDEDELNITRMFINFNKKLPLIQRIKFEEYDAGEDKTNSNIVYITNIDTNAIQQSTFELPTEEEGYTINTEE